MRTALAPHCPNAGPFLPSPIPRGQILPQPFLTSGAGQLGLPSDPAQGGGSWGPFILTLNPPRPPLLSACVLCSPGAAAPLGAGDPGSQGQLSPGFLQPSCAPTVWDPQLLPGEPLGSPLDLLVQAVCPCSGSPSGCPALPSHLVGDRAAASGQSTGCSGSSFPRRAADDPLSAARVGNAPPGKFLGEGRNRLGSVHVWPLRWGQF